MSLPQSETKTVWIDGVDTNGICQKVPQQIPVPPIDPKTDIRCYVMANVELPPIHAGIQASHALADLVHFNQTVPILKEWMEKHKTLVLLSANSEQMIEMRKYFSSKGMAYASFLEPDLDNMETAIAFQPVDVLEGKVLFGKFKLFK